MSLRSNNRSLVSDNSHGQAAAAVRQGKGDGGGEPLEQCGGFVEFVKSVEDCGQVTGAVGGGRMDV